MNQRERTLTMLKAGPVCGRDFLDAYIARFGARIEELRKEGYVITTRPCKVLWHGHRSRQFVYELEETDQLRMFG